MKFVQHSRAYGKLVITLQYASGELCRFWGLFLVVNLSFAVTGMLLFGKSLEEFSSMSRSLQTLMMMMTGRSLDSRL